MYYAWAEAARDPGWCRGWAATSRAVMAVIRAVQGGAEAGRPRAAPSSHAVILGDQCSWTFSAPTLQKACSHNVKPWCTPKCGVCFMHWILGTQGPAMSTCDQILETSQLCQGQDWTGPGPLEPCTQNASSTERIRGSTKCCLAERTALPAWSSLRGRRCFAAIS